MALHVGTLCVVLAVFRKDVLKILKALIKLDFKTEEGKLALFIAVGSVPTAFLGLLLDDIFESLFYNPLAVGTALIITGFSCTFPNAEETPKNWATWTHC